jgi:hypothetical protein
MRMSKRQAADAMAESESANGPNGEPPRKRVVFEPLQLGPIANLVIKFNELISVLTAY